MIPLAHTALFAWIGIVPLLFTRMDKQRAVLIALIGGWLFLPQIELAKSWGEMPDPIQLPPFFLTKTNAICYGLLLAVFSCDSARLFAFRFRWFDLPVCLWCLAACISTVVNDMKITETLVLTQEQVLTWAVPYFIGRLYFGDLLGIRRLALGFLLGGLAYVPLCLLEIRLSPELHLWVWGFHQHDLRQSARGAFWRPMVFMQHGLAVGMWIGGVTLLTFWMWWTRSLERLEWLRGQKPLPLGGFLILLLVTCVLMGSAGALALGLAGAGVLVLSRWLPVPVPLIGLMLVPPLYMIGRTTAAARESPGYLQSSRTAEELDVLDRRALALPLFGFSTVTGEQLHDTLESLFNKERADSFQTRLVMEDRLMEVALQRPVCGWGGYGRARLYDPGGKDISITDGRWIMTFGDRGAFGLAMICLTVLLPTARMSWTYPQRLWSHPALAPAAALAVLQVLTLIDDLSNAMLNLLFITANGALAGMIGTALTLPAPLPLQGGPQETGLEKPVAAEEPALPGVLKRRLPGRK